ncbi:hypothetical protein HK096_003321, partial [Nowakowskiella sp. JEL0078]
YRLLVIRYCPQIENLDGITVTNAERVAAEDMAKLHLNQVEQNNTYLNHSEAISELQSTGIGPNILSARKIGIPQDSIEDFPVHISPNLRRVENSSSLADNNYQNNNNDELNNVGYQKDEIKNFDFQKRQIRKGSGWLLNSITQAGDLQFHDNLKSRPKWLEDELDL